MAGILSADRIIESEKINQKIQSIGVEVSKLINLLDQVAVAGSKITNSLSGATKLSDINGANKQAVENAKNLATIQKSLLDIEIKLSNAIKAEQQAKQSKITTDSKTIDNLKKEQQLKNLEIQTRIKNAQQIAAEERAKQSKIRTDRLEEQGLKKSGTAFRSLITSMRDYLTLYIGISQATQLVKNIFNTTRTLDSLDFAIKKVITDQLEFAQTQQFLSRITDAYGAELITTTERYIKFRAASQQSNISASQTQKIFESVTKTSGVLGLKTDELTGVYLALEQMMSKGKVTTEELRRQLGERLPGAFGIMAKALGVTIPKLDQMLKKGEVLSTEALPKFAIQLEKSFGIENVTRVNTLAAAQNRYTIAWQETVKAMESSNFFISVIESATNTLKGLRDILGGVNEEFIRGKSASEIYANSLISDAESAGYQKRYEAIKKGVNSVTAAEIQKAGTIEELNKLLTKEQESATKKSEELKNKDATAYGVLTQAINENRGELLKQLKLIDDVNIITDESTNKVTRLANEYKKKRGVALDKGILESSKEEVKNLILQSNSIEILKSKIKELSEVKKTEATTEETDAAYKKQIRLAKEKSEKELAEFKRNEQLTLAEQAKASNELIESDDALKAALEEQKYESDQRIIAEEIRLQEELLKLTKDGSTERASIESEIAKFKEDAAQTSTDRTVDLINDEIAARKKALAQQKKDANDASKQLLSDTENNIIKEQTILTKKAGEDIKAAKGNAQKTKEIRDNLAQDMLNIELMYRKDVNNNDTLMGNDKQRNTDRIIDVEKNNEEQKLKRSEDVENAIYDVKQQIFEKSSELVNAGFDLIKQSYDNQLSVAQETYNSEIEAAGDNLTERIIAERKFEKEKKRIARNQAIAEKLQAAFSIALSTAQAIIAVWANPLTLVGAPALTALIATLGAVQLATVLAQPIPAYHMGVENAPETFIAGDTPDGKGATELIHTKSGLDILTPEKATLFSDPMFKGAKIFPHDKTQEMLNSYAINGGSQVFVDMSGSEKYLNQIAKNTRNTETSGIDEKGRRFIKRGSTVTTY